MKQVVEAKRLAEQADEILERARVEAMAAAEEEQQKRTEDETAAARAAQQEAQMRKGGADAKAAADEEARVKNVPDAAAMSTFAGTEAEAAARAVERLTQNKTEMEMEEEEELTWRKRDEGRREGEVHRHGWWHVANS